MKVIELDHATLVVVSALKKALLLGKALSGGAIARSLPRRGAEAVGSS